MNDIINALFFYALLIAAGLFLLYWVVVYCVGFIEGMKRVIQWIKHQF